MTVVLDLNLTAIVLLVCLHFLGGLGFWYVTQSSLEGKPLSRVVVSAIWPVMLCVIGLAVLITLVLWPGDLRR